MRLEAHVTEVGTLELWCVARDGHGRWKLEYSVRERERELGFEMATPASKDPRQELYEAYLAVPEHQRAEIIEGTLYVSPRPAPRHTNATSALCGELHRPFQRGLGGPGGWWILREPEVRFVELEPMAPDLTGWRAERIPVLPEEYFTVAPDWICEVLSSASELIDRTQKLPIYAAARRRARRG